MGDNLTTLKTLGDIEAALAQFQPRRLTRKAYTLEHMERLLDFLGNPQNTYTIVHVAGTSGKTSTAYYAAALLNQAGYRVGLTVSPHTYAINERVQIGLEPLPEATFGAELAAFMALIDRSGIVPTYFEMLTAFAFWEFARQGVEYAVIEVGLGGLLDATNMISRADKICIVTDIGLDHTKILGSTLGEIAAQKAGIIQLHNALFCYEQAPEIMAAIENRARQKLADVHQFARLPLGPAYAFLPLFQRRNFALANKAISWMLRRDAAPSLQTQQRLTAAKTPIPGRFEEHHMGGKLIVLDGAHNGQKLAALRKSMHEKFGNQPIATLVAFLATEPQRVPSGAAQLARLAHFVIASEFVTEGHPTVDAHVVAQAVMDAGLSATSAEPDLDRAWQMLMSRPEEILLVTGSIYLLGYIRSRIS